ncbi:MAG TPA: MerR family DNA-binding transcriptional regulator [Stellaceae bacterium]|nr:MerR family DNA-binding transcriptional regulator [Stellaceae bacterium]
MQDDQTSADRARFWSGTELAAEFSLTAQGIRFYEEKGLLSPARAGRTRVYSYRDRARLILVQKLRRLGFSIDDIGEYLSFYKSDATGAAQYRVGLEKIGQRIAALEEKRRDIDEALAELKALEREAAERLEAALAQRGSAKPLAKNAARPRKTASPPARGG